MTQPPQTKSLKPIDELRGTIDKMKSQFALALPKHIDPDRFVRIMQTAIATNPDLVGADRNSLLSAAMKAAQDGLLPDGREAALVMFGNKAQYMPMIGGILKKIRNSGELATITAQVVHKNDTFEYYIDDTGEHFKHVPNFFGDRGAEIGAYALARTKDGSIYIEVMTEIQIDAVKNVSRSKNAGPWSGPFKSEMKKKTVLRRLAKRLPSSTDLDMVFKHDDEDYDFTQPEAQGEEQTVMDGESVKPSKKSRLMKAMGAAADGQISDIDVQSEIVDVGPMPDNDTPPPEIKNEEIPI